MPEERLDRDLTSVPNRELINLTPHNVVFFDKRGENIVKTLSPSGTVARVKTIAEDLGCIAGIPFRWIRYWEIKDLPEKRDNTNYIVSGLVLDAMRKLNKGIHDQSKMRYDLLAPDTSPDSVVRDENGKIQGVRGLVVTGSSLSSIK